MGNTNGGEIPVIQIQGSVTYRDFRTGYFMAVKNRSPIHLPQVRAGLCLTGAVLLASLIPMFQLFFFSIVAPICGIGFFLLLAGGFLFLAPVFSKNKGAEIFFSNKTLALPRRLLFFREYLVLENEYESVREYWTDMEASLENHTLFVLKGGKEKNLIVIPKGDLHPEEQKKLSEFLSSQLVSRHHKVY